MKSIAYILCPLFLLVSCGRNTGSEEKSRELSSLKKERSELDQKIGMLEAEIQKSTPERSTAVSVLDIRPQIFRAYVEVQAQITGDENVLATPQAPGVVQQILVKSGQKVREGQTLAILNASAIEQQIRAQEAQLGLFKVLYEKQQRLWSQNIGTEIQLLQAKAQFETAQSQKQALIAQRDMYRIKSPISGVVDEVDLKEGDAAAPGMRGIRVVSKEKLKATADLGENYLDKIRNGNEVTLEFPEIRESIQTRLSYVSQSVDPISRSFRVEARLGANAKLHPNMSSKMKIINHENNRALLVPVSVIQNTPEGEMIFIAQNDRAVSRKVKTGLIADGMIEILEGLNSGDKVIVAGFQDLDNGEMISIQ